ncbi:MAG TPA: class D sortase [Candidatus Acidoferrales bacterium]|nr:class D sortase [Candidatus Acidoferrales bacterium]
MIVRIQARPAALIATVLKAAQLFTFSAGAGLLGWAAFVVLDSTYTQWAGARALAAERGEAQETIVPKSASSVRSAAAPRGAVLGNFAMPRLGLSYVLLEGTDARTLDKSIGRVEDTARLGESGNIGIAGHRNTHFRKLEWVRRDDEIILTSHNVEYRYRVEWVHLYKPDDLEVLDPSHGPAVTLITCFPFEYVGSAPLRFVVRALPDEATRTKLATAPGPTAAKR